MIRIPLLLLVLCAAPSTAATLPAPLAPAPLAPAPLAPARAALAAADEVNDLNDRARKALDDGKPSEAVLLLQKAVKLAPAEPVLAKNLAWAYFQRGKGQAADFRFDEAIGDYREAAKLNPEEIGYRVNLGQLLMRGYRLDEAEDVLAGAVKDAPKSWDCWLLLGDTLGLQDHLPEALDAYGKAAGGDDAEVAGIARSARERTQRQYAVEKDYRTDLTTFFTIRGPNTGAAFGVRLAGVLERARTEVCNALGVSPQHRNTIVVLYPPDEFRKVTGTHEWVGGLFDRKIRLPIADVERDRLSIEAAFRHEFTHLIVSEISPSCPTFVNEGLAQVMEFGRGNGMKRLADYLDARPGGRAGAPAIGDLPASFVDIPDRDTVSVAYLLSYAFLDHVISLYGSGAAMNWVRALASEPLADAYKTATGRTLESEESRFRELLRTAR